MSYNSSSFGPLFDRTSLSVLRADSSNLRVVSKSLVHNKRQRTGRSEGGKVKWKEAENLVQSFENY